MGRMRARGLCACMRVRLRKTAVAALLALVLVASFAGVARAEEPTPSPTPTASPTLTFQASPTTVLSGAQTVLTATIGVPNATLILSRKLPNESEFVQVETTVADASGKALWVRKPDRTITYRVSFAGDAQWAPVEAEATVAVKPRVSLSATKAAYSGGLVTFSGRVLPARPGETVVVQRLVNGTWQGLKTLKLTRDSKVVFRWKSTGIGKFSFRLLVPASSSYAVGASKGVIVSLQSPNPYRVPINEPRIIVVDHSKYKLFYCEYGRIVRSFDCVLGKPSTPTPIGHFRIYAKDTNVGGAYGPRRMRYLGAYAIHGTNEPHLLKRYPRRFSHGCTRLANQNILWLFPRCRVGTQVWNVW